MTRKQTKMNILTAIKQRDSQRFLEILDRGFKAAARNASEMSHALGLNVADGRATEERKRHKKKRAA